MSIWISVITFISLIVITLYTVKILSRILSDENTSESSKLDCYTILSLYFLFITLYALLFFGNAVTYMTPKAIDVYRGNTELKIYYSEDSTSVDTIITFKKL